MLDGISLATLTDGLLGGVLGAVGAFGAAVYVVRVDRKNDRRREEVRSAAALRLARTRSAQRVTNVFKALETEVRLAPFLGGRTQRVLIEAIMEFQLDFADTHPEVLAWLLRTQGQLTTELAYWRRVWWMPVIHKKPLARVGKLIGESAAASALWAAELIDDSAFRDEPGALEGAVREAGRIATAKRASDPLLIKQTGYQVSSVASSDQRY